MKNVDPLLLILTVVVGLSVAGIMLRVLITGELGEGLEKLLVPGATMFGALLTAIATARKKDGDDGKP